MSNIFESGFHFITMRQSKTSYHFKINTSEETMEVFGTVMSLTAKGILLDLWCPEEPGLNQQITTTNANILQTIETLLQENLKQMMPTENYSIQYLSY